ncbi:ribonuclease H-like domain-containing protein [Tanacetum coccineum]
MVRRTCNIKRGQDTKIPQSGGPPVKVGDEAVHRELGDRMERAATTASSLEAEQDSGNINRTQSIATLRRVQVLRELVQRLVPSCFVIFDLEPLSLSLDFFEHEHVVMNPTSAGMRHHHLHLYIQRISLTGFPAQSVGSSNTDVLDLPCLLVLITGTSQSRQHVDTSLIHIESRKSPTAVLFDDDTGRISIRHCIDLDEKFGPVCQTGSTTSDSNQSLAISRHWLVHQLDVKNAFLHGSFIRGLYKCTTSWFSGSRIQIGLPSIGISFMGLKQYPSGPVFQRFAAYAARVGFHHSRCDSSLFIYRQGADTAYLLLYVDDIVLTASSSDLLQQIITSLHERMFQISTKYATEVLDRACMLNCKRVVTPVVTDSKLFADFYAVQQSSLVANSDADLGRGWSYRGVANAVVETCWLCNILCELHTPLATATLFYCDNVSVVYLSSNPVQHQRTKHIEIDIHFVRDLVATGAIRVLHVPSRYQYVDIFTKGLPTSLFDEFHTSLSVRSSPAPTAGGCLDSKIPQSGGPPVKVGDEAVHKELGDRMERAATTASSLEAEQDSGNINRTQSMATLNKPESGAKRKKSLPRKRRIVKRQKLEEDAEKEELKGFLDIIPREEFAEDVESLSTKYPIVDWKTYTLTENFMYYQIFRGDGSSKNYKVLSEMLEDFDRQDVEELYRLVKERYSASRPEGYDLMLWGDLHTLFEPDEEDEIWKNQHEYNVISWSLYDFCGIHILLMQNGIAIHMLTEKKYPLSQEMISKMLKKKLEVDHESSQAFELLRRGIKTGVYDYPEGFTGPSISIITAEPVTTAGEGVSTARAIPEEVITAEPDMDVTLAEALVDLLKSGKKKSPKTKERGIFFQDPEEVARREVISPPVSKILTKDKGKAIMTEPEKPLKKKDQIQSDEELALRLHAEEQAKFERLQKERVAQEEVSRAAIYDEIDNIQAMIEADKQLATRVQAEEQELYSIKEK